MLGWGTFESGILPHLGYVRNHMTQTFVITDRESAYQEIDSYRTTDEVVGLLRFPIRQIVQMCDDYGTAYPPINSLTTPAAQDKRLSRPRLSNVQGVSSVRGVELIHSMVCGYSLRLLVIDGIQNLLSDPEARVELRKNMKRIHDHAIECNCNVWVIAPDGWSGGDFMVERAGIEYSQWRYFEFESPQQKQIHADAEFIAHAREDVPFLLSEIKRLRDELDSHKSALALIQAIPIDAPQALARCKGYAHSTLKKWNDEGEYLLK